MRVKCLVWVCMSARYAAQIYLYTHIMFAYVVVCAQKYFCLGLPWTYNKVRIELLGDTDQTFN